VVLLACDNHATLQSADKNLKKDLQDIADIEAKEVGKNLHKEFDGEDGKKVKLVVNHFGYVDGVSQPLFYKRQLDKEKQTSEWDPFAPLKLVLTNDPNSDDRYAFGSYMAYQKLKMDSRGFADDVKQTAKKLGIEDPDLVGAYAVGRFKNGTPVINSSHPLAAKEMVENNFNYQDDSTGSKCPFHSHTRKTNPRGDTSTIPPSGSANTLKKEKGHRIVRRSISYTYGEDSPQPTGQGLLFICYQADLINQFEFMQNSWANSNSFVMQDVGQDALIGQKEQIPQEGQSWPTEYGKDDQTRVPFNVDKDLQKRWIVLKGGEYFFSPSMDFLQNINQVKNG